MQPALPAAEAASDTQQPAGGGKKEKERQRKERQRQRRMEEAREALQVAMEAMALGARCVSPLWLMCIGRFPGEVVASMCGWQGALTCGGVCGCSGESALGAVEEATAEAAKHGDRSEPLAALVAEARVMIEQAKTEQAERARAAAAAAAERVRVAAEMQAAAEAAAEAAEVAAAVAAVAARAQLEKEMAALALTMEEETLRLEADALRMQQVQAQLGVPPAASAPHPDAEEMQCVVCFDAPKDHIIVPCGHMCVCASCAEQLTKTRTPMCPVCREPILQTMKVFCS